MFIRAIGCRSLITSSIRKQTYSLSPKTLPQASCRFYAKKKKKSDEIANLSGQVSIDDVIDLVAGKTGGKLSRLSGALNQLPEGDVISTGSLALDLALSAGGLPRGRVIEIFGLEASGKTSLALSLIAQAQKKGGKCAFIDVEHALDPFWAKKLGVNIDELLFSQPDSGEEALNITEALVLSGHIDVVVVDSVAALVTASELSGEMGDQHVGLQARLMSQATRKLTALLKNKSNTMLIFINQIRMKIGVPSFVNPETTPGGLALKFAASVRLEVRKAGNLKVGDEYIGSHMRVRVAKNKVGAPMKTAEFDIFYDRGISREGEILDFAVKEGLVNKSGSWYVLPPQSPDGTDVKLGQGRDKARAYLEQNPEVANQLEKTIRERSLSNPSKITDQKDSEKDEDEPEVERE